MDDFSGMLSTALGILSIATLAGLGLMRGTVTNLRESLADARAEIADLDRRHEADEKKVTDLTNDVAALQRTVTGEVHWIALGETLDHHHDEAKKHWEADEKMLADILAELRGGTP